MRFKYFHDKFTEYFSTIETWPISCLHTRLKIGFKIFILQIYKEIL